MFSYPYDQLSFSLSLVLFVYIIYGVTHTHTPTPTGLHAEGSVMRYLNFGLQGQIHWQALQEYDQTISLSRLMPDANQ